VCKLLIFIGRKAVTNVYTVVIMYGGVFVPQMCILTTLYTAIEVQIGDVCMVMFKGHRFVV